MEQCIIKMENFIKDNLIKDKDMDLEDMLIH